MISATWLAFAPADALDDHRVVVFPLTEVSGVAPGAGSQVALLLGAERSSDLVDRLYQHSDLWVRPFYNLFGFRNEALGGGSVFEPASLFAFIVYFLVGSLLLSLFSGRLFHRFQHAHA